MSFLDNLANTKVSGGTVTNALDPAGQTGGTVGGFFQPGLAGIGKGGNPWHPMDVNPVTSDIQGLDTTQQQGFINALQAQNGLANQNNVFQQQNDLAGQLQSQAMGNGPNPALAQLGMTTNQNMAQQAAAMGSQRGVGGNPALLGRHIAEQGAATQQQAAGQAAVMRANQQLAAQQALMQQQGNMAGVAGQQVGNYGNAVNSLGNMNASMTQQGNDIRAGNARATQQGQIATQGADTAMEQSKNQSKSSIMGGGLQGAGGILAAVLNKGGTVPGYADGGYLGTVQGPGIMPLFSHSAISVDPNAPKSSFGQQQNYGDEAMRKGFGDLGAGIGKAYKNRDSGSVSAGNVAASGGMEGGTTSMSQNTTAEGLAKGGKVNSGLKSGGNVPGKAKVKGDSIKNDNVLAALSPGEIVIPRSIVDGPDAPRRASDFVAAILSHHGRKHD